MSNESDTKLALKGNAYKSLAGSTLGFFFGFAAVALFGITVSSFKESMELTPILVGLLVAIPNLTGSLLRIPFGAWVDSSGGRKPFLILLILSLAGLASLLLISIIFYDRGALTRSQYPILLMAGALSGCGIATFSVGIGQVSYWFRQKKQGMALGTYAGLGNLAPGLFSWLLPMTVAGWGISGTYGAWLFILFIGILLYALFGNPAPYFQFIQQRASRENAVHSARELNQEIFPSGGAWQSLKHAAEYWQTWILVGIYFVTFGGFLALTGWFPTYWQEFHNTSLKTAGLLTATYSILASLIRVPGGRISDIVGGEKTLTISLSVMVIGALLLTIGGSFTPAFTGLLMMALGMGVGNAAVFKLVPQEVKDAVGGAAGWVGGLGAVGGFVIPPIMGAIVDVQGTPGYAFGFMVFVSLAVMGLILSLLLTYKGLVEWIPRKLRRFAIDLRTGAIISAVLSLFAFLILFDSENYHLVGNQQGYAPVQPIDFSHKIHAGDNQISCLYCHSEAEKSATAGFPSANVCMNCHSQIKQESEEVQKIVKALDNQEPIQWIRIHNLADFVRFNHSAHATAGVTCQTCHGLIELETRVRQFASLGMGWCVNCHRQYTENPPPGLKVSPVNAATDCITCHY